MFGALSNAFGAARDRAVEAAARAVIARKIAGFGELNKLAINSTDKSIDLEVMLKGEVSPVRLRIGSYQVVQRQGEPHIIIREVQASREWITSALKEYVVGREFKLPAAAASVLG